MGARGGGDLFLSRLVSLLLIFAGIIKLLDSAQTALVFRLVWGFSSNQANRAVTVLAITEIVLGTALLLLTRSSRVRTGAVIFLSLMTAALIFQIVLQVDISCGCGMGQIPGLHAFDRPPGAVARNVALILLLCRPIENIRKFKQVWFRGSANSGCGVAATLL